MYQERLKQLRQLMKEAQIDFYYVPAADAHSNEYVPEHWQRRAWITGFTGSAGDALIGLEHAYLWTDGRYYLQAEQQLNPALFQLMKGNGEAPPIDAWLKNQNKPLRVGVDPKLLTLQLQKRFYEALHSSKGELVPIETNLIDTLCEPSSESTKPILRLELRYAGTDTTDKLSALRNELKKQNAEATVLTRLDEVAWLFNIRGNDIQFNPLVISYAIISQKEATLFIDPKKLSKEDIKYFNSQNIKVENYEHFDKALEQLHETVLLDPQCTSWKTLEQLQHAEPIFAYSPVTFMKSIKNTVEQAGAREAHRIDAIAIVKFLHWIEQHWQKGVTEMEAADQLEKFRREDPRCKDLSFPTISGFGSNGAIVHYHSSEATNIKIDDSSLYLIDSGAQYFEGTTDITRTIHLGNPTPDEKKYYTLVLKGHMALRHTPFPAGYYGEQINALARQFLWQDGNDYAHGTGHGVGSYLCVHEGPQHISSKTTTIPLRPGMIVSNEPGVYFRDRFGIRIENLCLIVPADSENRFYQLDDLTLVPYARNLIDCDRLSRQEIEWIDHYHQKIYQYLANDLSDSLRIWLEKATKPLK